MAESKAEKIDKLQLEIEQVTRTKSVLNRNQIQKIFNSTPRKYQYERPAKGGGSWRYIKSGYVRRVMDSVFGYNWSFDVDTSLKEAFEVASMTGTCVVKGTLRGSVQVDGSWVELEKTQFGRAEVKFKKGHSPDDTSKPKPLDFGNDMKAATSDCFKKCASLFGIGADIYEADEFMEIEIIGSDENSDRKKATKKKIEEAKKALKSGSTEVGGQNE